MIVVPFPTVFVLCWCVKCLRVGGCCVALYFTVRTLSYCVCLFVCVELRSSKSGAREKRDNTEYRVKTGVGSFWRTIQLNNRNKLKNRSTTISNHQQPQQPSTNIQQPQRPLNKVNNTTTSQQFAP